MSVRDAIEQRSFDGLAEVLAPDVVWVGLWPGELCRNRDETLEMFGRLRDREWQLQPTIVAEKDNLLVVDPGIDERHHVLVLAGDLISEARVYPDRRTALAAVEERPAW